MSEQDTGGPAYPKPGFFHPGAYEDGYCNCPEDGKTLLDAAALAALPEMLRIHPREAIKHAYDRGEEFIAEKRRREGE